MSARRGLVALAIAAACASSSCAVERGDGQPARRTDAIVPGELEPGEPAVVAVLNLDAHTLCTGTIISPRIVLTAKHCVQGPGEDGPSAPGPFRAGVGNSILSLSEMLEVESIVTTPGVWRESSLGGTEDLIGTDIALLTLVLPTAIPPHTIRRDRVTDLVGQEVTAIGYGATPSGDIGTKYRTTTRVITMMGETIVVGTAVCGGDSGGPLFEASGRQVGVASVASSECGTGIAGYNALDRFLSLIDDAVRASGGCVDEGSERCDGADNDCDGEIDEDCLTLGEACDSDARCWSGLCAETEAGRICSTRCDAARPFVSCRAGFVCARVDGCDGLCVPGVRGARPIGSSCDLDRECSSGRCVDPGDGVRRCLDPCRSDAGLCIDGETCVAPPLECGACVPASLFNGTGIGEPCVDDAGCASSLCIDDSGFRYCSRVCTDDASCPDPFHCRDGACARGAPGGRPGEPCVGDVDCGAGMRCESRGGSSWCAPACTSDAACPDGLVCDDETSRCAPVGAVLGAACRVDADCFEGACMRSASSSFCSRACSPDEPCPSGLACRRDEGGSARCVPAERGGGGAPGGGGCSVTTTRPRSTGAWWIAAAAFALPARRARKRRRS